MKDRPVLRLILTLLMFLAAVDIGVLKYPAILGYWRGESKYQDRYTNEWRAEMKRWEGFLLKMYGESLCIAWCRESPFSFKYLEKLSNNFLKL